MNRLKDLDQFLSIIDSYKKEQSGDLTKKYTGLQELFQNDFFKAFIGSSPLAIAIYNFPSQKYDFISESIKEIYGLNPEDFTREAGVAAFIEALDEHSKEIMIHEVTPLMMETCSQYAAEIKNLLFSSSVCVQKSETEKKWVLMYSYILEATPDGFPILSCTIISDITEIKKDSIVYYSAKLKKDEGRVLLYQKSSAVTDTPMELSERELEVLKHLCLGKTSKQIAEDLFVSINTIRKHRNNILSRTGVANTAELINKATVMGLA